MSEMQIPQRSLASLISALKSWLERPLCSW